MVILHVTQTGILGQKTDGGMEVFVRAQSTSKLPKGLGTSVSDIASSSGRE